MLFRSYFTLGHYFNIKKQSNKAYYYLKQAYLQNLTSVKQKYVLFVNEYNYGKHVNDELSVACYWTEQYKEGIQLIEEIIDDPQFAHDRDRLATNLGFLKSKISQ